jgi:hypothetical protein
MNHEFIAKGWNFVKIWSFQMNKKVMYKVSIIKLHYFFA